MRLAHTPELIVEMRQPTAHAPLRLLSSACMLGRACGVDGSDYGMGGVLGRFIGLPEVRVFGFCPEAHSLGIPRTMPDIHGGDGFDVLDGHARVLDEHGEDLSDAMIAGARAMLAFALEHQVELAILTDTSAACGSQVISDGCRYDEPRSYRAGVGVATALLLRHEIPVLAQRDYRSLELLLALIDPEHRPDLDKLDHHQSDWYREYFAD